MAHSLRFLATFLVASIVFTTLDLIWLGEFMGDFYNRRLGALKADPIQVDAAIIFYLFYLSFVVRYGAIRAASLRDALLRGMGLGYFAYGTYELTNWAVIQDWPVSLVPVDIAWGICLTGSVSALSYLFHERLVRNAV